MPLLLLGLVGISIPILIHLLHRQRTQPVLWGAMQFLRISQLQMKRRKKVDHWLLMLLRILAVAFLALMLARPRWISGRYGVGGLVAEAPVDVAVVLDHSLSTGRSSGGQTVFEQGVAATDRVLDQLKRSGDTISVVLAEHKSRAVNVVPIKISDRGAVEQLRQRLRQEKPGMTDCSIPEAISTARRLVGTGRNANKLVIVVSDQQRANWHVNDDALWHAALGDRTRQLATTLAVHSFPITPDADGANVSVGEIQVTPTVLGVNRPVQINATVSNTGSKPMSAVNAKLVVNGKQVDVKPVAGLEPKTSATIRFDIDKGVSQPGSNFVKVSVDAADSLAADNETVAAANVLQKIPVLIIDSQLSNAGSFKSSQFIKAAMQPDDPSLVQAKVVSVAGATEAKFDEYTAVVVNDVPTLPQAVRDRLADYVRSGHGLWIILGPRTSRTLLERDLPAVGFFKAAVKEVKDSSEAPSGVEVKDANNPMISVVTAAERNALTGAATRKWWSIKPQDADTQVVLAASNGDPLIMERPFGTNRGIVAVWTTSVDGEWNNWPLMPNFVPMVNETVYHLSGPQMRGLENHGIEAGQPIEWAGAAKPAVQSVQITLPDNTSVQRPATFNNGRWVVTYPDTYLPGIYKLQFTPTEIPPVFYGVNIDRKELDPTPLAGDDVEWLKRGNFLDPTYATITASDLPVIIRKNNNQRELYGWVGGLLLAVLLFETYMTYRMIRTQRGVDVAGAGLITA